MQTKLLLISIFILLQFNSCASMPNQSDQELLYQNQQHLKIFLNNIVYSYQNYSVEAFADRTQISYWLKRTKLLTHSFFVITLEDGEYHTLSYSNAKPFLICEGKWILNKKTDIASYGSYIEGKNFRDVIKLFPEEAKNSSHTLVNIIDTINSGVKYYYRDHLKSRPDFFNCNTALSETIVFEQQPSQTHIYLANYTN